MDEISLNDLNALDTAANAEAAKYDQPIQAGIEGAARAATFGLSDVVLAGAGGEKVKEGLAKRAEYNPIAEGIGQAGGIGGSLFMPGFNLVKGVGSLGKLAEGAVAKTLVDVAAESTAKKILSNAAAKGLGAAIEGGFYGAGQVASEAALGDPSMAAEHALSTIGLSALLSGGLVSSLNIAGPVIKEAAKSAKPILKAARQQLVGVAPDVEHTILNRADDIKDLLGSSDNAEEAILNRFQEKAVAANDARYQTIESARANVADLIQKHSLDGKARSIKPLFERIDEARSKISPSGKVLSKEIESEIAQINDVEHRLVGYVLDNAGIDIPQDIAKLGFKDLEGSGIKASSWKLNPSQLNDLKSQYFKSTDFSKQLGKVSEVEKLYESLGALANKELDQVSPLIRKENARIGTALKAQEKLKQYGLFQRGEFDPQKMRKLASIRDAAQWAEVKGHLQTLDDIWGTDLKSTAELARAAKQVSPKDILSGFQTGRSLLGPVLGGALGSVIGGPVAAGVGVLGSAALSSPAGIAAKIKAANAIENMLSGKQLNQLSRLGGKAGALVSDNMIPFVSGQIAGLSMLKNSERAMDRHIDASIKGFTQKPSRETPTSISALNNTNFGKGRVISEDDRQRAFEKRLEEITKIVTNPNILTDLIGQNLKGLSMIAPNVANSLGMQAANAAMFLYSKAPKPMEQNAIGLKQEWKPSDSQLAAWERYVDAVENPKNVLDDFRQKRLSKEGLEALQAVYPGIYNKILQKVSEKFFDKSVSYQDRLTLGQLFHLPVENAMKPKTFGALQMNFQQQQPQPTPTKMGDVNFSGSRQSQSQRIEAR